MPGPFHGWLYQLGPDGTPYEIINHARTLAYLQNVGLPNGILLDVYADEQCATYPYHPPCGQDSTGVAHANFASGTPTGVNALSIPDSAAIQVTTQLDFRFAIDNAVTENANSRYIAAHEASSSTNRTWDLVLNPSNTLGWTASANGTAGTLVQSDDPLTDNDGLILGRVTWRDSDGRVQFLRKQNVTHDRIRFELNDDDGWEQFGLDETSLSGTSLFDSTAPLLLGTRNTLSTAFRGTMYGAWLSTTIDGAPGLEFYPEDITDAAATTFTATSGQTVTVTRAVSGPQLTLVVGDTWDPQVYVDPATDDAPWYSVEYPESADALGFIIQEWTGLGNPHTNRSVSAKGGLGGGGQLGVISNSERTMSIDVLLHGRSEEAVQYLFDWLSSTLAGACATCATDSYLIRRSCGSVADLWQGVAKLNQVGLISGPDWEVEILERNKCFLRRATFVLAAGDPCMYLSGEIVDDDDEPNVGTCLASLDLTVGRNPCRPTCFEVSQGTDCRYSFFYDVPAGATVQAPVLSLTNHGSEYSIPCRAIVYYDPLGLETAPGLVNPCGLQILGQLYVRALRSGATLVWDVSARDVLYRDFSTGGLVPGWAYVDPNDPPERRWFALPCGQIIVVIEPATFCLDNLGAGLFTDGTLIFQDPHFPTPTLEIVPRVGCV